MKTKLHYVLSLTMFLIIFSVNAQNSSWKKIENVKNSETLSKYNLKKDKVLFFELDVTSLNQKINTANYRNSNTKNSSTIIKVPGKNGKLESFKVYEAPVFSPSLAIKYPNIRSYVGTSIDNTGARLRMSTSPQGIQTMISYINKPTTFMQPLSKGSNQYVLYNRASKNKSTNKFECNTIDELNDIYSKSSAKFLKINQGGANDQTLRKFRIAISTTSEYTAYHGGIAGALSAINATLTRVNDIFETDMAVTFELVDATQLIYTNAVTDPYSDADFGADQDNSNHPNGWSLQLQNTLSDELDTTIELSNAAYDIGHLFGASGGGGNAGCIGCVCDDDTASATDKNKGSGFTSPANDIPEGDTFDLNYVIHEIGHQMGANHTWAFDTEGTQVNSEPGSGTTVMGYAGLKGPDDVQADSDPYFHYHSINQILTNLTTQTCWQANSVHSPGNITNNPPIANAGSNYTIPASTPYILKGNATDTDSDALTYCWEQTDSGKVDYVNFGPNLTSGSMNRSLPPSNSSNRFIPKLTSVLNGNIAQTNPGLGSDWETVASVDRTLNWALTVRDRNPNTPFEGQSSFDTMQIEVVDGTALNPIGPFMVTSQSSSGTNWTQGGTETITWDVANTNLTGLGNVNTQSVNILLSTDGGLNFDTILMANTPNDGTENITVPNIPAPFCRIMVEPTDNIYYAINSTDFAIGYTVSTICEQQTNSSSNLNLDIFDGTTTTNTINVPTSGVISDIKLNIDVNHTFISDLTVLLTHPNGSTSAIVWDENCFIESGYVNFDIILEDDAPAVVCASPTSGTYIPANSLSVFDGLQSSGDWTLSITDGYGGDEGVLNDWYIEFCTTSTTLSNPDFINFEDLKVFPNPNKGEFIVKLNSTSSCDIKVEVHDLRGRTIYKSTYKNTGDLNEKIQLNDVQSGVYILNVSDGLRKTTRKIIVE